MRAALTVEQCWHRVPGGTAVATLGVVRGLLALPSPPELVGLAARHAHPPAAAYAVPDGIPVRHAPLPRPVLYEAWHGPGPLRWPTVERLAGSVDVVHATALVVPPSRRRLPLVVTVHDLAFLRDDVGIPRRAARLQRRGLELARRYARRVLVPSEATAADCVTAGIEPARLRIVPWGVDLDPAPAPQAAQSEARARYGLPERFVLFVGTAEPRKNLPSLLDAWHRLGRPVDLVLAGPDGWGSAGAPTAGAGSSTPAAAPSGRQAGGQARGPGRLHRLGFVADADRAALLAAATVVAYPSRWEGFGLPVLEAMAQGAPVLTSRGTATEEVAGDAAVLVDPFDIASIAAGLAGLLADDAAARALGERARARAATYTWAACAEATRAAYEEAAA